MPVLEALLAIPLLVACGFAPGFFVVRRLRWSPMEKLCGSIGISFTVLYLVFTAIYHLSPSGVAIQPKFLALVSAASVAIGLATRRDVVRLFGSFRVRQALAGFFFLLVWTLLILAMIRNYSGANWFGDWLEHFQRSLFFLLHFPVSTPITQGYQLPARPPAMNELAAFFLAQTRDRFEVFQVIFAFLNLLMFLPCCLIMRALVAPRRTFVLPLTALFAMNPVVIQSATYTWTKAFTAFYVILALWFYLAAWRKNDFVRMTVAFVALSMGVLAHYSAAPYLLFLTLHYLLRLFWKRPHRFRELATIAVVSGLLLATWFGWSIGVYGAHGTFAAASQRYEGNSPARVAANVFDSIVPVFLRNGFMPDDFDQQGFAGFIRDKAFVFYQSNAIFGMGLVGGPLILWLLYCAFFRRLRPGPERSFWLAMIPFCIVVGIASTGERDFRGVAQLALLPMEILGLSLLAAMFPLRRRVLILLLAGCLIDFSFGIFLHTHIESLENTSRSAIFPGLSLEGGRQTGVPLTPDSLSGVAWDNWFLKHQYALSQEELAELTVRPPADAAVGRIQLQISLAEDEGYWHGWYARNNGAIEFLGDHTGEYGWGTTVLSSLLLMLLFGLVRMTLKQAATVSGQSGPARIKPGLPALQSHAPGRDGAG
jgi:hypothetical protein